MRDCCAGFWGTVRRSGVTLPLFEIITSLLLGREKNTTNTHSHTHTRCSHQVHGRSYGEDVARWATEMASVQHIWIWASVACSKERERYRGKRGRERWREGGERERAVSINMHQSDGQCVTWQCKQTPLQASLAVEGCLLWGGWLVTMSGWVSSNTHPKLPPPCPLQSLQSHPSVRYGRDKPFLINMLQLTVPISRSRAHVLPPLPSRR